MTLDRHPAAAAERRPDARMINRIRPTSTRAPRRIHSHSRLVPVPVLAAGEPLTVADGLAVWVIVTVGLAVAVAVAVTVVVLGLGGAVVGLVVGEVTLGVGEASLGLESGALALEVVALRLGAMLAIALLAVLLHPAARHTAARIAAERRRLLVSRRMPDPSVSCDRPLAGSFVLMILLMDGPGLTRVGGPAAHAATVILDR